MVGKTKKEVKVKKTKKEDKVSTGVENLDNISEGGFEKNSVNLLVGGSGSGKSIFAAQFLVEGIKRGENVLYVTFEEKKEEFFENMAEIGWDFEKSEREGKLVFLEYSPEKVRTMLEEGGGTIESTILSKKITRVVIDSITSFELLFNEDVEKRSVVLELFNMLRKWNCTSLLTYEQDLSRDKKISSKILEFESDSIIMLYFIREEDERERYIEVYKMRGTKHSTKLYPFEITDKGIVISSISAKGKLKI